MNHTGIFMKTLELGALGDHDAVVMFSAYRPARRAEDDYPEMCITSVTLDLCGTLMDVTHLILDGDMDDIKSDAWDHVPTAEDIASERADAPHDARRVA